MDPTAMAMCAREARLCHQNKIATLIHTADGDPAPNGCGYAEPDRPSPSHQRASGPYGGSSATSCASGPMGSAVPSRFVGYMHRDLVEDRGWFSDERVPGLSPVTRNSGLPIMSALQRLRLFAPAR